ncbi:MAG TPA: tetratricopeptide repeat protein [Candidatus Polarisedimenticolaceae bacterium]|nr:tetratricopeptide repeat protein [Candidatus Polarisedimenticolaceae bacterium]
MKIRTALLILVLLGAVYAVVWLMLANRTVLEQHILLWGRIAVPVGVAMFLIFFIGAGITFLAGLSHEAGTMIERWRERKAERLSEEIEEEYSRGLVAVLEGREDQALAHFRAVLERDSRHFNTQLKLGDVLRAQGRFAEAIEYHRKAHHLKEDSTQPLYALVEDYEAQGNMERARAVLGRILAINKNSVAAWRKLRALLMKEQNWDKALEAHERVEKLADPQSAHDAADRRFGTGIRYEMATTRLAAGKTREAISALRRLIKEQPQFIPAHVELGEALRAEGQEADAVQAWRAGFEMTGSPTFLTALEEHFLQREQPLAAIEALKDLLAQSRKDTLPRFYLGKLYFRLEMLDDAFAVLSSLEGRASYAPTLHYLLGRIRERRNNFREAVRDYRKVIKELDLVGLEYRCRACGATAVEWTPRCSVCGEWNHVEVDFREELPLEELGLAPAPIYTRDS